jgi:vacuolar-type H+-ATPase subunit F/Vma7
MIDKIEVTKRAKTRRSKLYYIRDKAAKEIRRKMKTIVTSFGKKKVLEIPETEAPETSEE